MNSYFANFTKSDCYEIIKKKTGSTDVTVDSYEFRALSMKKGFLGDHCFLTITYNHGGKIATVRLFAKSMPTEEFARIFTLETGAFGKEYDMYTKLVPAFLKNGVRVISECVPDCYLASDTNYMIFEDLSAQGYATVSHRESMPLECVKIALDGLAKLHCSGLIFEETVKKKTGEMYKLSEKFPKLFVESFFSDRQNSPSLIEGTKNGAKTQIDLFEGDSRLDLKQFKELACREIEQLKEMVKPSGKFRNTICHGDLWSTNVMFKFEDGKPIHCYLVDFQSYRYGPPAQDFLGFMYLSTDRQFRQRYLGEMTEHFYQRMTEILRKEDLDIDEVLPRKEFMESCDYYKLFSVVLTVNHFPLIMASSDMITTLLAEPGTLDKVFYEDKSVMITPLCEKDPVYRRRLVESIADLKEVFLERGLLKYRE